MLSLDDYQLSTLKDALQTRNAIRILVCLKLLFPTKQSGQFVEALGQVADHNPVHAKILYTIAITLYEQYFPEEHAAGLHALSRLSQLLEQEGDEQEISKMIDAMYPLVLRAATAIGKIVPRDCNGNGRKTAVRILKGLVYSDHDGNDPDNG